MAKFPAAVVGIATAFASLLLIHSPAWLSAQASAAAALSLITIALYATGLVAEALTSLLFFLLAMLFVIAPAPVIFSGFSSAAFWIIFGGLILGLAIRHTGLGEQVARSLVRVMPSGYAQLIAGAVTVGGLFAFFMPGSIGRVVLLVPIALAVADRVGFDAGRNGRVAIALGAILGTQVFSIGILPANVPNAVWLGSLETILNTDVSYFTYLLWNLPVLGLFRVILLTGLLIWLLPDQPTSQSDCPDMIKKDEPKRMQWHLAGVLLIALLFWMTDGYHGISPAWIALAAGCYCLIPGIGLVPEKPLAKIDIQPLLFVAAILGLGAMIRNTGLAETLLNRSLPMLPFVADADGWNFALLAAAGTLLSILTTAPGVPAILMPLAPELAAQIDWSTDAIAATIVVGYSTSLLPYQLPPVLIGAQLAGISVATVTKILLIHSALSFLLAFPLQYFWLTLLDVIPG
ncbi:MAG: anion permease [Gammaproteobacteria bacterium]|nr:anion permease [Gammaproteobacteria bacterium]